MHELMQGNCTGVPKVADQSLLPLPPLLPGQCVLQLRQRFMTISLMANPISGPKNGQLVSNLLLRVRSDWADHGKYAATRYSAFDDMSMFYVGVTDDAGAVWLSNMTFQGSVPQAGSSQAVRGVTNSGSPVILQGASETHMHDFSRKELQ
jgi:hypothetical protein